MTAVSHASRLERFFAPKSIAIFGASDDFSKINGRPLKFLLDHGYDGALYPINPKYEQIAGLRCYPDFASIADAVDLAIVAVPARAVAAAIEACVAGNAGGAIVFSSGFSETGAQGRTLEERVAAIARDGGLPLCGPNTVGFWNAFEHVLATFSQAGAGEVSGGPVAFITQSGAFGTAIIALLRERGMFPGYFVNSGNEAVLTFSDIVTYALQDERIRVIAGYIEGLKDGPKFLEAAEEARRLRKPIVVTKVGRSQAGARAAMSHTGSLAGSDRIYSAAFAQKGVVRANNEEELLDFTAAFSLCPLPNGQRIALVTQSGGAGVLMADCAESEGLAIAEFTATTNEALKKVVPEFGSIRNPVDITAQFIAQPSLLRETLEIVLADPGVDVAVFYLGLMDAHADAIVEQLRIVQAATTKPLLVAWAAAPAEARAKMGRLGLCCCPTATRAVRSAAALVRYAERSAPAPAGQVKTEVPHRPDRPEGVVSSARTFTLLESYGIAVAPWRLARNAGEAALAASAVGYPVALKIESTQIPHKSDAGGVRLHLLDEAAVRAAYDDVLDAVRRYDPAATIDGVLVQRMAESGIEMILGVQQDPVFGPIVMAGVGGIFVEVMDDVSFRVAPVTKDEATSMLQQLKAYPLLSGVRGQKPCDVGALADLIVNLSRLAVDRTATLRELDLNPVKVLIDGACVVDALLVEKRPEEAT